MNDLINGLFELFGGLLLAINVVRLRKDKSIKGVSWLPVAFFTAWGLWNLHYYPSLNQWFSFAGGLLVVFMNGFWLALLVHYYWQARPSAVQKLCEREVSRGACEALDKAFLEGLRKGNDENTNS